jgi:ubiquinone/menaquinone biosynthesis C-methylase UbiE
MKTESEGEIQRYINELRDGFLTYTRKAYRLLPEMARPRVLDIGCGTGAQTMELARLGDAEIVGIDIDGAALDELNLEIERQGLSDRIQSVRCSLTETDFPHESFDILWEEGVLHILDVKRSLTECRRLLKPGGFLVMNETLKWFHTNLQVFPAFGFKVVNHFNLPPGIWWTDYYEPLEKRIAELRKKDLGSRELELLARHEREIEMVGKNPAEIDCAFYIVHKVPYWPGNLTTKARENPDYTESWLSSLL